jgi:hypothetical protein
MSPQASQLDPIAARRAAVEASQARYGALKRVHAELADELAGMPSPKRAEVVSQALANVGVWESKGVSSPLYARVWRSILREPSSGIARMLQSPHANALVQNSPFGFVYSEPKYRIQLRTGDEAQG